MEGSQKSNPLQERTTCKHQMPGKARRNLLSSFCSGAITLQHARRVEWCSMGFISWVKNVLSYRGKAISRYRKGMAKANQRDYVGAIADYSAAIRDPNIPVDVKAMALYNRALAYAAMHEGEKSAEDIVAVLEMPGLPQNIKMQAKERQERMRRRKDSTANL
jgi:hypothetical protein